MGLTAAYRAALTGHQVDVVEAAAEPGGMAGHFDFDGVSIGRFYHFVSKTDEPTFDLLDELGLSDKLHWVPTTMGFFNEGDFIRGETTLSFALSTDRYIRQASLRAIRSRLRSSRSSLRPLAYDCQSPSFAP